MKKCLWIFLGVLCLCGTGFSAQQGDSGQSSLWLIQEEFVKFGKKELYENLKQSWLEGFKKTVVKKNSLFSKSSSWDMIAMQDSEDSQYMYLTPLQDYSSLGAFLQSKSEYEKNFSEEEQKKLQTFLSTINFTISSLHQYLFACSYLPSNQAGDLQNTPYLHYWVLGITPGYDKFFEDHIEKMAMDSRKNKAPICWRMWKVLLGADTPKYVIVVFSSNKESLEEQVNTISFIDNTTKDIIRNQKQGSAVVRTDLSLFSSGVKR